MRNGSVAPRSPIRRRLPARLRFMTWLRLDEVAYRVLPQVEPGRALASSEWLTLHAAAETLLERLPLELTATEVADNVEQFLCTGRSKRAWRCRVLLTLLELITFGTHARRFSALSVWERKRLFEQRMVGAHGLWGICAKVRYLVIMGAYGDERAHAQLGVWVPSSQRPERSRRGLPLIKPARPGRAHGTIIERSSRAETGTISAST